MRGAWTSRPRTRAVGGLAAALAIGCSGGERADSGWTGTVSDSAGITVVRNPATGLWPGGAEWRVVEDLVIGAVEGDPDYLFGAIAGVCVSSAGDIVVVDRQVGSVRVFDSGGHLARTFAGLGAGPGELGGTLAGCFVGPGDTIAIPDLQLYRVSRFLIDGTVVGAVPFDIGAGIPLRWAMRRDGRLLAQLRFGLLDPSRLGEADVLVAESPAGTLSDTAMQLPVHDAIRLTDTGARYTLLAPQPVWTRSGDGSVWVYDGGAYRLIRYDAAGSPTTIVSRAIEPHAVGERDRALIALAIEQTFPAALVSNVLGGVNVAAALPFVFALATGPEGTLWAQRVRRPATAAGAGGDSLDIGPTDPELFLADVTLRLGSPEWDVFDAEGRYLGVVTFPERFDAVRFRGDAVYGIWRDTLGVEYVKRLRIVRSE